MDGFSSVGYLWSWGNKEWQGSGDEDPEIFLRKKGPYLNMYHPNILSSDFDELVQVLLVNAKGTAIVQKLQFD